MATLERRNIHMPVGRLLVHLSVRYAVLSIVLLASAARAAETETQYLSGLGKDDPVKWEFMCDKGMNANKWSTIGVPSNRQLQGFGIYEYGRPNPADGWPALTASTSAPLPRLRPGGTRPSSSTLKVS